MSLSALHMTKAINKSNKPSTHSTTTNATAAQCKPCQASKPSTSRTAFRMNSNMKSNTIV